MCIHSEAGEVDVGIAEEESCGGGGVSQAVGGSHGLTDSLTKMREEISFIQID